MKIRHLVPLIVLVCATLLSSHPSIAQFSQQGTNLQYLSIRAEILAGIGERRA
ncbi:MAG: hypothetical protein O2960_12820 [Verrucomicrobia bacterium]|nr:hypothetical protein [Verrucomicrobiota bacterium]